MREFGWSIEYTLSLSFPVFLELSVMIRRLRCDAAVDEFYLPYAAVKVGGKPAKRLFEGRGSFLLEDKTAPQATEEETQRALEKLRRIIAARRSTKKDSPRGPVVRASLSGGETRNEEIQVDRAADSGGALCGGKAGD